MFVAYAEFFHPEERDTEREHCGAGKREENNAPFAALFAPEEADKAVDQHKRAQDGEYIRQQRDYQSGQIVYAEGYPYSDDSAVYYAHHAEEGTFAYADDDHIDYAVYAQNNADGDTDSAAYPHAEQNTHRH